ncbi:MAG: SdpI family protein [Coprobacillus sp.]
MKKRAFDIFMWVATLGLTSGIFFLPDKIPLHWNGSWQIDRYGSRYEFLIITLLPIVLYYGFVLAMKIDPKRRNFQSRIATYELIRKGISVFLILVCCFFYYMTLNPHANGSLIMCVLTGCLFIAAGNYMPKLPQNFSIGIRTPWAISNERVWRKTQKFGGYSFVLSGIVIVIWGLFNLPNMAWAMVAIMLTMTFIDFVYSYIVYKKIESE